MESSFCVDTTRIFSTGMSYGGMMSDTVACQLPDVFRAIGVMSGSLGFGSYVPTCANHPQLRRHRDRQVLSAILGSFTGRRGALRPQRSISWRDAAIICRVIE